MKADLLTAEIGSTTTVVNAFTGLGTDRPRLMGQGFSPTTVVEGDVTVGLKGAVEDLSLRLGADNLTWGRFLASSSAAGGLRMSVHGLVYDMTVKAAKEAALGAGANIHQVTAGRLHQSDLDRLVSIRPNIIMIAGGVDYGERDTALENGEKIALLDLGIPVIYAGNIQNHKDIQDIFKNTRSHLYLVDNVYPSIDRLNVLPARRVIQDVFEEHIIHAPGMEKIRTLVDGPIIPTPGAVMEASLFLRSLIGDLVTFDVGGATTDIHSVTPGNDALPMIQLSPEPLAKRTVEGDLGVYINRRHVLEQLDKRERENLCRICGVSDSGLEDCIENLKAIPETDQEREIVSRLTAGALKIALKRHVGSFHHSFTPKGKQTLAEGRDLTGITYFMGTGGALTRLREGRELLREVFTRAEKNALLPPVLPEILIDDHYIMASLGVISREYPEESKILFTHYLINKSLGASEIKGRENNGLS